MDIRFFNSTAEAEQEVARMKQAGDPNGFDGNYFFLQFQEAEVAAVEKRLETALDLFGIAHENKKKAGDAIFRLLAADCHYSKIDLATAMTKLEEKVLPYAERINAVSKKTGKQFPGPLNARSMRAYIFKDFSLIEMRLKEIEEALATAEQIIQHALNTPTIRDWVKGFMPEQRDAVIEESVDRWRLQIWQDGPLKALENALKLGKTYRIPRIRPSYALRLRDKMRSNQTARPVTQERPAKVRTDHPQASNNTTRPCEKSPAPLAVSAQDILQKIYDQEQRAHSQLQDDIDQVTKAIATLQADIENLNTDFTLEKEIAAEHAVNVIGAFTTRRFVAAQIAKLNSHAFTDERIAPPAIMAQRDRDVDFFKTGDKKMRLGDAGNDLVAYETSADPAVRALADKIKNLRTDHETLESRVDALRDQEGALSSQRTCMQRELQVIQKSNAAQDVLLSELKVEQAQMEFLLDDLKAGRSNGNGTKCGYPATLRDLEPWAHAQLQGRVIILNKAFRAAAKSLYEKPAHVYAALELLGREFHDLKMCHGQNYNAMRAAFHAQADALKVTIGSCFGVNGPTHKYAQEYETKYRDGTIQLDSHLIRGTARDPRFTMRIYFGWDDVRKLVVVGHLPGHLSNRFD